MIDEQNPAPIDDLLREALGQIAAGQLTEATAKLTAATLALAQFEAESPAVSLLRARAIYVEGRILQRRDQLEPALTLYQEAVRYLAENVAGQSLLVEILNRIGLVYMGLADFSRSSQVYEQAYKLAHDSGDAAQASLALENMGNNAINLDQPEVASSYLDAALDEAAASNDPVRIVGIYGSLTWFYGQYGPYPQAYIAASTALALVASVGNLAQRVSVLSLISEVYLFGHHYQQAQLAIKQAEGLLDQVNQASREAEVHNVAAKLFAYKEDAVNWEHHAVLAREKAAGVGLGVEYSLNLLLCWLYEGKLGQAAELLTEMVAAAAEEAGGEIDDTYHWLLAEANAAYATAAADYQQADLHFKQSLASVGRVHRYDRARTYQAYAVMLHQWAVAEQDATLLHRALDTLGHALKAFQRLEIRPEVAAIQQQLAAWSTLRF